MPDRPDAVVVGAGPNGLAAAIVLARAGRSVTLVEARGTVGGGARSAELTLPGFIHDVCSAVYPLAPVSPAFRDLPLASCGLDWIEPAVEYAHPFDDGTAAWVARSVTDTAGSLGPDARAYERLLGDVVADWPRLERLVLGGPSIPRHPIAAGRFARHALQAAQTLAHARFGTERARGLFAGVAAHGMLPLDRRPSAAFGLVLGALAHVSGWVFPRGGAQRLSDALAAHLCALGGRIITNMPIRSLDELPASRAVLCDLSPKPLLRIAGDRLPDWYRRKLERYRYGLGVFKVDWALDAPIPWRAPACHLAGTVHLGGGLDEIARSEAEVWQGRVSERPFVLLAQPTLVDPSRAPQGRHTAWAYCHVPHASRMDMLPHIEAQIERFAPGFRERVLARAIITPADLERENPNLVGGDIAAGSPDWPQLIARPTWRWHATPSRGLYICSAATPPGVGVHGMCGALAAQLALREVLRD